MKEHKKNIKADGQFLATLSSCENELGMLGITTNMIHIMNSIQEGVTVNHGNMTLSFVSALAKSNKEAMQKIIQENNFDKLVSVISETVAYIESAT